MKDLATVRVFAFSVAFFVAGVLILIFSDFRRHDENHQRIQTVAKVASKAEHLAIRDHALIYAICRQLHARDTIEAYYDNTIAAVAHEYASRTNAYQVHVRPLYAARNRAITKIASGDCQALMQRAMYDAPSPTAMPTAVGMPF